MAVHHRTAAQVGGATGGASTAPHEPRGPVRRRRRPGRSTGVLVLAAVLLLADAAVLLGDMGHRYAEVQGRFLAFAGDPWDSQRDGSYAEVLGYAQVALAALLLAVAWRHRRAPVLAAWSVLLVVVLLDDALGLHEHAGFALAEPLGLPAVAGLRAGDLGELLVWACYGTVLLLVVLVLHRRSEPPARRSSWWLLGGLVVLAAAGAGLDLVHQLLVGHVSGRVEYAAGLLESAGELAGMSLVLLAAAAAVARRPGDSGPAGGPGGDVRAARRP